MLLAFDTSIGSSVAVVSLDGEIRAQVDSETSRGHAEVIGGLIHQALDGAGIAPADITHVAAGMGPGPFTGLRIGIAAARAFATGRGVPVVPVVSHDAAALDAGGRITIVTDARRREHAVSRYSGLDADGLPVRTSGPELVPASEMRETSRDADDPVRSLRISEDLPQFDTPRGRAVEQAPEMRLIDHPDEAADLPDDAAPLDARRGRAVERPAEMQLIASPAADDADPAAGETGDEPALTTRISAGSVGVLAARMLASGRVAEVGEPLYLRAPDAKVPGAVKRVST